MTGGEGFKTTDPPRRGRLADPEVSIVIRSYNEQRHLPTLFDSLDRQEGPAFEAVVVDSGSVDRSREIAAERGARVVRIKDRDFTFGYSLNEGIRASRGRYIAIVSSHTQPTTSTWLAELVRPLADDRTAMAYGRQLGGPTSKFAEKRDFERTFGADDLVLRPPHFFANNANSAVRRDLWTEHPFDETLPGLEDIAWAKHWMERGYRVVYAAKAAVYHYHDETWPQVRRRYYREAMAAKWISVKGRRHIPREAAREAVSLVADTWTTVRRGTPRQIGEIARFRWEKMRGTTRGLWDAASRGDPRTHQELFFDRTAKAVVIAGHDRAALEDREIPRLKPADVLVKVAYTGVCATDLDVLEGTLGYYRSGRARYPIVPGHEISGRVAKVGAKVEGIRAGDPVVVECIQGCGECTACRASDFIRCDDRREVGVMNRDGGYAEFMVTPSSSVHRVPPGLSLRHAALAEPLAVVQKAIRRLERATPLPTGSSCAVVGAGTIGHLMARSLAARGLRVLAIDADPMRLALLADAPGVRTTTDIAAVAGVDVVIEATGSQAVLEDVLRSSSTGAALLLLGFPYGGREFNFEAIVASDKTIVGSVGSSPEDFEMALSVLPKLDLSAFEGGCYALADFRAAWAAQRARSHLKVTLDVDPSLEGPVAR